MKIKIILLTILLVAIGAAVCSILIAKRQASGAEAARDMGASGSAVQPGKVSPPVVTETPSASPALTTDTVSNMEMPTEPLAVNIETNATPQKKAPKTQRAVQPKEEIQDPVARAALSYVGADPDADDYWIGAINNPDLSDNERKDLIEDLNEDGLSDPHNPGPQDIPLILNRLQLIEDLAPNAMDQVNADAFQEAYKDLVNMLGKLPAQ